MFIHLGANISFTVMALYAYERGEHQYAHAHQSGILSEKTKQSLVVFMDDRSQRRWWMLPTFGEDEAAYKEHEEQCEGASRVGNDHGPAQPCSQPEYPRSHLLDDEGENQLLEESEKENVSFILGCMKNRHGWHVVSVSELTWPLEGRIRLCNTL